MARRTPKARVPPWLRVLALVTGVAPATPAPRTASRPARRRRTKVPDFQRSRIYRWEAEHVLPHAPELLSLDVCRALVHEAYVWAERPGPGTPGWSPPEVTDGRGRRHACGSRQVIKLPRWARTRPVVLHECAHGLADDKHGPRFVGIYVALLVRFLELDRAALETSLQASRVRFQPWGDAVPAPRRAARRRPGTGDAG
jgi:hypothetical protein